MNNIMKWETIKNKCVKSFNSDFHDQICFKQGGELSLIVVAVLNKGGYDRGKNYSLRGELSLELHKEIISKIDNWDIRQYNGLKEIFPKCFPKDTKGIDLTDKGWEIV